MNTGATFLPPLSSGGTSECPADCPGICRLDLSGYFARNQFIPAGRCGCMGLLANPVPAPAPQRPDKPVPDSFRFAESAAPAQHGCGSVPGLFVLPADYLSAGRLPVVHTGALKNSPQVPFYNFLTANLLKTDPLSSPPACQRDRDYRPVPRRRPQYFQ